MILCNFPEALNFDQLILKLNRFISYEFNLRQKNLVYNQ